MTTLILIRHGLTDYNAEHRIQGHLDTSLTPEGWSRQSRRQTISPPIIKWTPSIPVTYPAP